MRKPSYRPKYSLSLTYLEIILGKKELKKLVDKYVEVKVKHWGDNWKNYIGGKTKGK